MGDRSGSSGMANDSVTGDDVEYWQVHHPDPDQEYDVVLSVDAVVDEYEAAASASQRELHLTRGDTPAVPPEEEGQPYLFQSDPAEKIHRTIIPDENVALAYFIHGIETNGIETQSVVEAEISEQIPEWFESYQTWRDGMPVRDRRLRLMDLLDWRVEEGNDWHAEKYVTEYESTWRQTGLSEEAHDIAERIWNAIDAKPRLCYRTAQKAALVHIDNHRLRDRIKYVEGICLPNQANQAIRHAWIEIDGAVVELTWPWHAPDPEQAVYFGVEFPLEMVQERRENSDVGGSLALDEEQLQEVNDRMRLSET